MQALLALPLPLRLAIVFVVAAVMASFANAAIYHFAWRRRFFSPWQPKTEGVAARSWLDYLPIFGWWRLRRESSLHGTGHWVRPMLIELFFPLGIAWLYWWETEAFGLIAEQVNRGFLALDTVPLVGVVHVEFLAHAMLAWFMLIATFIDADDRIIPDTVTVPGTMFGLILATLAPMALLPQIAHQMNPPVPPIVGQELFLRGGAPVALNLEPVHLAAPAEWPAALLAPAPNVYSLLIGLGCFWLWCFAFVRRRWLARRGFGRAVRYFFARIARDWWTIPLREVTAIGTLLVTLVWWWGGGAWVGLLSSLVGLVGAGGVVWLIRIFAGAALRREAMGFGDVLLMMMIGTLIGWQAGVIVFFAAPFAALVYGVVQLVSRRENELPYGPFLCAATVLVIVRWGAIWLWIQPAFMVPWLVPVVLVVCLVLCGAILAVYQAAKDRLLGPPQGN